MVDVTNFPVYDEIAPKKPTLFRGQIISASIVKISSTKRMVVDIVVHHRSFRRFAISSIKVGTSLYEYIYSNERSHRMKDIDFDIWFEPVSQKVTSYQGYDLADYITEPDESTLMSG